MKNKIIIALGGLILLLLLLLQSYRLSVVKEENKKLEIKLEIILRQNEFNKKDSLRRNKEIKNAKNEIEKLRKISKETNNECLHAIIPIEFSRKLREDR